MKKQIITKEIDTSVLKSLKLFESVCSDFNTQLGFSIQYLRVPTGLIRTTITPEAISQQLITLPNSFFS